MADRLKQSAFRRRPIFNALRSKLTAACACAALSASALTVSVSSLSAQDAIQSESASEKTADTSEDRSMLERFLEDSLSSDNQQIEVIGLEGALSSRATIRELRVLDTEGPWLTLKGAQLDWNRLALIRGRFSVNTLSADKIIVNRQPGASPQGDALPSPETKPFALPELPVSVEIGTLSVGIIDIGPELLGEAAQFSLNGTLSLISGALATELNIDRLDRITENTTKESAAGPSDKLALIAGFSNETRQLKIDLDLKENDGGFLSKILTLPGAPSLHLSLKGDGLLSDFTANLAFQTDGEDRLNGQLELRGLENGGQQAADQGLSFAATLAGNIDPLLAPEYRAFFGPGMIATLRGQTTRDTGLDTTEASTALRLDSLALRTQALALRGALEVSSGTVRTANLRLDITPPSGSETVTLPVSGADTTVRQAELSVIKSQDDHWNVAGLITGVATPAAQMERMELVASGTVTEDPDRASGSQSRVIDGVLKTDISGLVLADETLSEAIGTAIALSTQITSDGENALRLERFRLSGADYDANGLIAFSGLTAGLKVETDLQLTANRLARFAPLTGGPLRGFAQSHISGSFTPLSGAFDIELTALTRELSLGNAQADKLIAGTSSVHLSASRGETGIDIRKFELKNDEISATAAGLLSSEEGELTLSAALRDVGIIAPDLPGPLKLEADVRRDGDLFSGTAALSAPANTQLDLKGALDTKTGASDLHYDVVVEQLGRLLPGLDGRLTADGAAQRDSGLWQLSSAVSGPLGINAKLDGTWAEATSEADINATGTLRLEGANVALKPNLIEGAARFELALKGQPSLDALSGNIRIDGAELVIPSAAQRLRDIATTVDLAQGRAQISVSAAPAAGGRLTLSGPLTLSAPFDTTLDIALRQVVLTDNLSYDTTLDGALRLAGALQGNSQLSGRIVIGETNFNLNTAGGAISAAPIPPIRHSGQTRAQIATRARAGLTTEATGNSSGNNRIALDIAIDAPNRIFARGRGLNAELGGAVVLRGTTADLAPSGQISLIRGTFDILGRRLTLDEGRVTLLGDLKPYLAFSSSANTEQGTATLEITGPVDAPNIQVTSDPVRPSEEALALLLFGDNIQNLSPLALARLASSALTLSGRGGRAQSELRDATGVDNVDIGADNLGTGQLGLGGYVADNVYTDFNITTEGDSELTINLDLNRNLTATGTVDSTGETGLGLFFKRDY